MPKRDIAGVKTGADQSADIEKMFASGAHYGYSKTRRHPSVSPYIFATKNRTDIIDLEKTHVLLTEAAEFMREMGSKGKVVLFVGTKPEAKVLTKESAESTGMPYVTERWIGGSVSNFTEIKKRILELENYQKESKEGGLDKYTKKERLMMSKKMEKLARYYTGLLGLKKVPDAILIVDAKKEHVAATEARKSGVPLIALVNSDTNIKGLDYPIVVNDASIPSIRFFATYLANAYKEGVASVPTKEIK